MRQDGRSASLTAPNGSAQRALLLAAISRMGLSPVEIGWSEAHGTGTGLGDPTEVGALTGVHSSSERAAPLAVGAAKANVGHSEAASGQVGMLKVQQVLGNGAAMGNSHLRVLNPLVGSRLGDASAQYALPTQQLGLALRAAHSPAGLSSFGYSGTMPWVALLPALERGLRASVGTLRYGKRASFLGRMRWQWRPAACVSVSTRRAGRLRQLCPTPCLLGC